MPRTKTAPKAVPRRGVTLPADKDILLTVAQAATLLQLRLNRVYELCNEGVLPHRRIGRYVRLSRHELEAWLAQQPGRPA